jgi:hypothetical protein
MSTRRELGVLSHGYKTSSYLSEQINKATIILKKVFYKLPGYESIDRKEIESGLRKLHDILLGIEDLLSLQKPRNSHGEEVERGISGGFIEKIRESKSGELNFYIQDLKDLQSHLKAGINSITEKDIIILNELCAIADSETSRIFREMWRK